MTIPASPETILLDLQRARATRTDELNLPRTMTQRQVNEYLTHTQSIDQHLFGIRGTLDALTKPTTKLAVLQPERTRLVAAKANIEKQISDAPPVRTITEARPRDAAWAHQNALIASLTAVRDGVEYLNGHPALPTPLRELLTDTCAQCGHSEVAWPGPLSALDADIAEAEKRIAELQNSLKTLMSGAAALLSESVPVSV